MRHPDLNLTSTKAAFDMITAWTLQLCRKLQDVRIRNSKPARVLNCNHVSLRARRQEKGFVCRAPIHESVKL